MATKQQNRTRRSRQRPGPKRSRLPAPALLTTVVVVALIAVGILIVVDQGASSPEPGAERDAAEKSYGPLDAPVEVVEYADFQCPFCREFAVGAVEQLKQDYADQGQVRFVFRHLAFIGDESTWAAEASECAHAQGRFWDYHDKLFQEQAGENQGAFGRTNLKQFAADLGLDTEQFNECLDSGQYRSVVRAEIADAQRRRIISTPTILVNGRLVERGSSYPVLSAAIEAALAGQ